VSEFDFTLTVTLRAKAKTLANLEEILSNLQDRLTALKSADKIDSAKITVSQLFKDRTWEIP